MQQGRFAVYSTVIVGDIGTWAPPAFTHAYVAFILTVWNFHGFFCAFVNANNLLNEGNINK